MPDPSPYLRVSLVYLGVATVALMLSRGAGRPSQADPLGGKLPGYVALNIGIVLAAWLPSRILVPSLVLALSAGAARELWMSMPSRERLVDELSLVLAWLYVAVAGLSILQLWSGASGGHRLVFCYLCIAAHDAFAQITGRRWGRRALAARISPAKTIEGLIGGLGATVLIAYCLSSTVELSTGMAPGFGLAIGVAASMGDLLASAWKRHRGIDDFGRALGAQGGFLDRFDSLLLAAITAAILFWAIGS